MLSSSTTVQGLMSRIADSCAAFWSGFTQPNPLALSLTAVTTIATAIVIAIALNPTNVAGTLNAYLPLTHDDANGFATRDALRLAHHDRKPGAATPPRIYVPGNSIIAQAFASDTELKRDLANATSRTWDVVFMTTPIQGQLDEAALLEYATRHRPGVVVLSISPDRLNSDSEHLLKYYRWGRLGFRSTLADRQVAGILKAKPRRSTGYYLFDNRLFFMRDVPLAAWRMITRQTSAERKIDIYLLPQTETSLARIRHEIVQNVRLNHRPGDTAVALLASTSEYLRARGNRIIFFNTPISRDAFDNSEDRRLYEVHLEEARQLAEQLGGHYCGVSPERAPPPSAYHDYYHIRDAAWQQRMRMRLAECVADVARS